MGSLVQAQQGEPEKARFGVLFCFPLPGLLTKLHLRACADYGRGRLRPGSERSERCR